MICSKIDDFRKQDEDLHSRFRQKGCPEQRIRASSLGKMSVDKKTYETKNSYRCKYIAFNCFLPLLKDFENIVRQQWNVVNTDPQIPGIFI